MPLHPLSAKFESLIKGTAVNGRRGSCNSAELSVKMDFAGIAAGLGDILYGHVRILQQALCIFNTHPYQVGTQGNMEKFCIQVLKIRGAYSHRAGQKRRRILTVGFGCQGQAQVLHFGKIRAAEPVPGLFHAGKPQIIKENAKQHMDILVPVLLRNAGLFQQDLPDIRG